MELRFLNVNPKISKALGFNCETTREEKLDEVVNTALFFEYQNSALDGLGGSGYQPWFSSLIPTQFAQDLTLGNSNSLNASAFATKSYEMDVAGFSKFVKARIMTPPSWTIPR